jgi:hypothetical protein
MINWLATRLAAVFPAGLGYFALDLIGTSHVPASVLLTKAAVGLSLHNANSRSDPAGVLKTKASWRHSSKRASMNATLMIQAELATRRKFVAALHSALVQHTVVATLDDTLLLTCEDLTSALHTVVRGHADFVLASVAMTHTLGAEAKVGGSDGLVQGAFLAQHAMLAENFLGDFIVLASSHTHIRIVALLLVFAANVCPCDNRVGAVVVVADLGVAGVASAQRLRRARQARLFPKANVRAGVHLASMIGAQFSVRFLDLETGIVVAHMAVADVDVQIVAVSIQHAIQASSAAVSVTKDEALKIDGGFVALESRLQTFLLRHRRPHIGVGVQHVTQRRLLEVVGEKLGVVLGLGTRKGGDDGAHLRQRKHLTGRETAIHKESQIVSNWGLHSWFALIALGANQLGGEIARGAIQQAKAGVLFAFFADSHQMQRPLAFRGESFVDGDAFGHGESKESGEIARVCSQSKNVAKK